MEQSQMQTHVARPRGRAERIVRLMIAAGCITGIWCVGLPWCAEQPVVQRRLEFLDEHDIDPSAMFYTELDAMDAILKRRGIR
jgi:hypothetical protein